MNLDFDSRYPDVEDLRRRVRQRIPRFAFEYLDGGCNEEVNLRRNTEDIRRIELTPRYLTSQGSTDLSTELFGETYAAPFGVAPMGLQSLMWPNAAEILAEAAIAHNVPFVLSTCTTSSIERIGELTGGRFWFQLYHPAKEEHRDDLLRRAREAGCNVLVILCDVPVMGFRPRDIRNGLSMPPRMSLGNVMQMLARPRWAWETLRHGRPEFESLRPYMSRKMSLPELGEFMNTMFTGLLNEERIKAIRRIWPGKLVLKGVAGVEDVQKAIDCGLDGVIVSNHGGRQLDAGEASIKPLVSIAERFGEQITVMMDSGIRSGPDIARTLACGARFTFLGRAFMYGVAALGRRGGQQVMAILKRQLQQTMGQICCPRVADLPRHLANDPSRSLNLRRSGDSDADR